MKKLFHIFLTVLAGASVVSCQQYLSANSPSTVDAEFVFSSYVTGKTVMLGAYNQVTSSFTSGLPTNFDDIGSDTERCSVGLIAGLVGASQLYGGQPAYTVEGYNINDGAFNFWNSYYSCISKCNQVIANNDAMAVGAVTALQGAGYNLGDPAKTIPVFGIDATDVAQALIRDGLMTGTVRQSTKAMAGALGQVAHGLLTGKNPVQAVAAAVKTDPLYSVERGHSNKLIIAYSSYP